MAAAVRYAPADPTLPKPWRGLIDGSTGNLYFWNPVTNVTQYDKPLGSPAPPVRHISSSVEVQSSPQRAQQYERSSSNYEGDHYKSDDNGGRANSGGKDHQVVRNGSDDPKNFTVVSDTIDHAGFNGNTNDNFPSSQTSVSSDGPSATNVGSVSVDTYRRQHEITVSGDNVPAPFMSFEATGFPLEILRELRYLLQGANVVRCTIVRGLQVSGGSLEVNQFLRRFIKPSTKFMVRSAGFKAPTPIQAQSWAIVVKNHDIVAIAKTGSGKTLGYLMPGFVHIKKRQNNPKMGPTVLVLSPTRELATQIQDEAEKFGSSARISCTCLYGGAPKGPQLKDLDRGVDIVVATPGRLNDIMEMGRINLAQVSYLVLDEADRMLDMGFEPQMRKVVQQLPPRRQTLMYTATWPNEVRKIASDLLTNPVQVNIGSLDRLVANKSITQYVEVIAPMNKQRRLEEIIRSQQPGSKVIVFCATKKMCDQLARSLTRPFGAAAIHGDKSQDERDHVLSQFRTGRSPVLVATDVAARGLDVKDIRVVINYDFPTGIEDYIHRIGRTGRAGATGVAYTFFGDQNARYASELVKILEGANQQVPPEVREMASCGGGGGMGRGRRQWDSGYGGRSSQNDSGYGGRGGRGMGRSDGGYGGRGYNQSYQDGGDGVRNRSRSPNRESGWGYTPKTIWNPDNY